MKAATTSNDPIKVDLRDRSHWLYEGFMRLMLVLSVLSAAVIAGRMMIDGVVATQVIQVALATTLTAVLTIRTRLPKRLVMLTTFVVVAAVCLLGVINYGLLAPAILVLVAAPIMSATVLGMRQGFTLLFAIFAGLAVIGGLHLSGVAPIALDAAAYVSDPKSWLIFGAAYLGCGIWGVVVTGLQLRYWNQSFDQMQVQARLRQQSEAERDRSEADWNTAAEDLPGAIFIFARQPDGSDRFEKMSAGCEALWGFSAEDIIRDPNGLRNKVVTSATLAEIDECIERSLKTMEPWGGRWPMTAVNGDRKWMQIGGRPSRRPDGSIAWHGLALDVTREVEAEEEAKRQYELAQQAQRRESIGQISGGVAHDFNNILAVIMGNLELLRKDLDDEEHRAMIDDGIEASKRGADLTRSMLAFASQASLEPAVLDLNALVRDAKSWIGRSIPANIKVETSLLDGQWPVKVDKSATVSAFLNLVLNARDAMPDGGRLSISTRNVRIGQGGSEPGPGDLADGRYVVLSVTDTGAGIPPEKISRIFEPFYTTKRPGAGAGLGLAMIQGFMKQSDGAVSVRSEAGGGARFELWFAALAAGEALDHATPPPATEVASTHGARILVAEDEPAVRRNIVATLSRAGYEVRSGASGDEAREIFERDPTFDLLVTDITMPGALQGVALAAALRAIRPALPVVFLTGYAPADTDAEPEGVDPGDARRPGDTWLIKPVARAELLSEIERALAATQSAASPSAADPSRFAASQMRES